MVKCNYKNLYFVTCLVFVIFLGSVRSSPVYGKLDFILLDGRPWWLAWRPMIEEIVKKGGQQPVLSDMITSTVLRAVFAQETVAFRFDRSYSQIEVDWLLALNMEQKNVVPVLNVLLLVDDQLGSAESSGGAQLRQQMSIRQPTFGVVALGAKKVQKEKGNYPYRCLINLHGFTPSWVPSETGHWSWKWAEPSLIYEYKGMGGKDMERLLRVDPPDNCMVYF